MAYYAYKQVRDLLPQHIIDKQGPDYEGDGNYDGDQWNAAADYIVELKEALAAKDARIAELEKALRFIEPHRKWLEMCCESLHKRAMYSEENACDQAAAAIGSALIALNEPNAEEHPDSARLDKLPACFHMLRTYPGARAGEEWWLTTDPRTSYATVREAIDAHKGDTNGPL